jgi:hypothetical protein
MTHSRSRNGLVLVPQLGSKTQRVENTLQASAPYEGGESRARFAIKPLPAIAEKIISVVK